MEKECLLLLQLRHPNIVQLVATCKTKETPTNNVSLILALEEGGSLADHLCVVGGSMDPELMLKMFGGLCLAVVYLHNLKRPIIVRLTILLVTNLYLGRAGS